MENNNGRYVFIFEYEGEWMIVCYWGNNEKRSHFGRSKYFNSAENIWGDAMDFVDMFLENGGNKYWYDLPDYDHVADIDIFCLGDEPIEELAEYLY